MAFNPVPLTDGGTFQYLRRPDLLDGSPYQAGLAASGIDPTLDDPTFNIGVTSQGSVEKAMLRRAMQLQSGPTTQMRAIQSEAMAAAESPMDRINASVGRRHTGIHAKHDAAGPRRQLSDILQPNINRARALSRAAAQGDAAERDISLKDRIAMAKFGAGRAGLAMGQARVTLDNAARLDAAERNATEVRRSSDANMFGSIAGALGSWGWNAYRNNQADNALLRNQLARTGAELVPTRYTTPAPAATMPYEGAGLLGR